MKIYFVRHPQTEWNKEKKMQGWLDSPLTEEGKAIAHMLGEKLRGKSITKIHTSDLGRCKQTASIINEYLHVPIIEEEALREQNFGNWAGGPRTDNIVRQLDENPHFAPPGGESRDQMHTRIMRVVQRSDDGVLIVTHEGCMRTVLAGILHKPIGSGPCRMMQNEIVVVEKIKTDNGEKLEVFAREEA